MTTIAYRDGILAADTQTTLSNMVSGHIPKIFKIRGALIGASGASILCQHFCDWVRAGMPPDQLPPMTDGDQGDNESLATGLLIHEGRIVEFSKWGCLLFPDQPRAIGSGAGFALAAMKAGASAPDAVRIACELDIYSSGEITVLSASK